MLWVKPHEFKDICENTTGVYQRLTVSKKKQHLGSLALFIPFIYNITLTYIPLLFRISATAGCCLGSSSRYEGTLGKSPPKVKRSSNNFTPRRAREKREQRPQNKAGSHHGTCRVQRRTPLSPLRAEEHKGHRRDAPKTMVFQIMICKFLIIHGQLLKSVGKVT